MKTKTLSDNTGKCRLILIRKPITFGSMHGTWFLPELPEKRISGSIELTPSGGSLLSLQDVLTDNVDVGIILGNLDDGTLITLVECGVHETGIMTPQQILGAKMTVKGAHFQSDAEISFEGIKVNFTHLPEWLGLWNLFSLGAKPTFESTKFIYKDFAVILESDSKIRGEINTMGHDTMNMMNEATFILIRSDSQKHYSKFIETIKEIKQLLMLATNLNIVPYNLQVIFGNGEEDRSEVHYEFGDSFIVHEVISPRVMLFTYDDVSGRLQSFINEWSNSQILLSDVYELFFMSIIHPIISEQQKFKNLANALECFHRFAYPEESNDIPKEEHEIRVQQVMSCISDRDIKDWLVEALEYSNDTNLYKRLQSLIKKDSIIRSLIGNRRAINSICYKITQHRNDFTHRCKLFVTDEELVMFNTKMRMILEVNILLFLNFSTETLQTITSRNLRYLRTTWHNARAE